jgi:hypothetical protein
VRRTQYDKQESRHLEAHQREQSPRTRHYAPYSPGGGTTAHSVLTAHNKPVLTTHIVQEEILQHSALTHKPVRHRCCSTPCGGCVHTPAAGRRLCPPECSRSPRWCGRTPRRWVAHTRPLITMGSARTHHPSHFANTQHNGPERALFRYFVSLSSFTTPANHPAVP